MSNLVRRLSLGSLIALGAHTAARELTKNAILILMYHGFVADTSLRPEENADGRFLEIGKLGKQLAYLKSHHNVLPMQSVIQHYRTGANLPPHPLVITVDDGYSSFYDLAFPLFQKAEIPVALFVVTDFLDKKEILWTDRLEYALQHATSREIPLSIKGISHGQATTQIPPLREQLNHLARSLDNGSRLGLVEEVERQAGVSLNRISALPKHLAPLEWNQVGKAAASGLLSVGSHTVSHPVLANCGTSVIRDELKRSKAIIESRINRSCEVFCYPFGTEGAYNKRTRSLVQEAGYLGALTTTVGLNGVAADVFELRRYNVDNRATWNSFIARTSGLLDLIQA